MAEQGWDQLGPEMQARVARLRQGLIALSQAYSGQVLSSMRRGAPWQNRTGNARNRLFAMAYQQGDAEMGIIAGHGIQYGIYLELGTRFMRIPPADPTSSGSPSVVPSTGLVGYPIVHPTLEAFRPRYFQAAERLMQRTMRGQA